MFFLTKRIRHLLGAHQKLKGTEDRRHSEKKGVKPSQRGNESDVKEEKKKKKKKKKKQGKYLARDEQGETRLSPSISGETDKDFSKKTTA
jgi:hypothetical protein